MISVRHIGNIGTDTGECILTNSTSFIKTQTYDVLDQKRAGKDYVILSAESLNVFEMNNGISKTYNLFTQWDSHVFDGTPYEEMFSAEDDEKSDWKFHKNDLRFPIKSKKKLGSFTMLPGQKLSLFDVCMACHDTSAAAKNVDYAGLLEKDQLVEMTIPPPSIRMHSMTVRTAVTEQRQKVEVEEITHGDAVNTTLYVVHFRH